jgi:hypothetical protein
VSLRSTQATATDHIPGAPAIPDYLLSAGKSFVGKLFIQLAYNNPFEFSSQQQLRLMPEDITGAFTPRSDCQYPITISQVVQVVREGPKSTQDPARWEFDDHSYSPSFNSIFSIIFVLSPAVRALTAPTHRPVKTCQNLSAVSSHLCSIFRLSRIDELTYMLQITVSVAALATGYTARTDLSVHRSRILLEEYL